MKNTGTIFGAIVLALAGALGRVGDDLLRLSTKGVRTLDDGVPAVTRFDGLPPAYRAADDAAGASGSGQATHGVRILDHAPDLSNLTSLYDASEPDNDKHRPRLPAHPLPIGIADRLPEPAAPPTPPTTGP